MFTYKRPYASPIDRLFDRGLLSPEMSFFGPPQKRYRRNFYDDMFEPVWARHDPRIEQLEFDLLPLTFRNQEQKNQGKGNKKTNENKSALVRLDEGKTNAMKMLQSVKDVKLDPKNVKVNIDEQANTIEVFYEEKKEGSYRRYSELKSLPKYVQEQKLHRDVECKFKNGQIKINLPEKKKTEDDKAIVEATKTQIPVVLINDGELNTDKVASEEERSDLVEIEISEN